MGIGLSKKKNELPGQTPLPPTEAHLTGGLQRREARTSKGYGQKSQEEGNSPKRMPASGTMKKELAHDRLCPK
jgi:hypothetical protein